jgi:hypothetical protein
MKLRLHTSLYSAFCALLLLVALVLIHQPVGAVSFGKQPTPTNTQTTLSVASAGFNVVGADAKSPDVVAIADVLSELLEASNKHLLDDVVKHYSQRFVSGDNLTLSQVQHLIQDTWSLYPDIKYTSKILEIRLNGDWATVESMDSTHATAQGDSLMSAMASNATTANAASKAMASKESNTGALDSRSRGLLFLHRAGKVWEIISDTTLYETATILFGDAKTLKLGLSSPDQVFSGEPYTAKIEASMPTGSFAIASITREPLVFPQRSPEEKFRTLSDEQTSLERVFQANQGNRNEMVTATIGLTQVGQDDQEHPVVKLSGIATIVKRVNVLPKSKDDDAGLTNGQPVTHSASGLINTQHQQAISPLTKVDKSFLSTKSLHHGGCHANPLTVH